MWARIQKEKSLEGFFPLNLNEVMNGKLRSDSLIKTYFPNAKPIQSDFRSAYRVIPIEQRRKGLESIFKFYGIRDEELPENYRNPEAYAPSFETALDFSNAMIQSKVAAPIAKKLVLLREVLTQASARSPQREASLKDLESLIETSASASPEGKSYALYLRAASDLFPGVRLSWDSVRRFRELSATSLGWVKENSAFALIRTQIELLAGLERSDPSRKVGDTLELIEAFEKDFSRSPFLEPVRRYRIAYLALTEKKEECFDALARQVQGYFQSANYEQLSHIQIEYSISQCAPKSYPWDRPYLAVLMDLPVDLAEGEKRLSEAENAYALAPELLVYQRARLFLAKNQPEATLKATSAVQGSTPLSLVTRVLRVRAFLALKRFSEAKTQIDEIAKLRKAEGAIRLLSYRAHIEAGDFIGLANSSMMKDSDTWVWILYHHATEQHLTDALSNLNRIPKRLRAGVFHVAIARLLPLRRYPAFDGLSNHRSLLSKDQNQVLNSIAVLKSKPDAQALLATGEFLRRVKAGAEFMSANCFNESMGSEVESLVKKPILAENGWAPYQFFNEALQTLKDEERNQLEPEILFNLISCYRPSNAWYPCKSFDENHKPWAPPSEREKWFRRLKKTFATSAQAKELNTYW